MWYGIIIFDIVNELIVRMGLDNKSICVNTDSIWDLYRETDRNVWIFIREIIFVCGIIYVCPSRTINDEWVFFLQRIVNFLNTCIYLFNEEN